MPQRRRFLEVNPLATSEILPQRGDKDFMEGRNFLFLFLCPYQLFAEKFGIFNWIKVFILFHIPLSPNPEIRIGFHNDWSHS